MPHPQLVLSPNSPVFVPFVKPFVCPFEYDQKQWEQRINQMKNES